MERSREEFIRQLEEKFEELLVESQSPQIARPCSGCEYHRRNLESYGPLARPTCEHPLVKGYGDVRLGGSLSHPPLCGDAHDLWEPRRHHFEKWLVMWVKHLGFFACLFFFAMALPILILTTIFIGIELGYVE